MAGFSESHGFAADNCVACHAGNSEDYSKDGAHSGPIPFPG